MTERTSIENWMLHAYADGELDAEERKQVEARLACDPAARAEVDSWLRQKALLKSAYDGILSEPVPASISRTLRRGPRSTWFRPAPIAASLALLIGGGAGWLAGQQWSPVRMDSMVDRAIVAYEVYSPEVRHPVEVAASESDHLTTWLSKRIGHKLKIPDLTEEGYTLLGGRLLAADDRPAAQLMYEDTSKRRIAVFLASNPGNKETAFLVERKGKVTACYWLDGPLGFVVTGEIDRDALMALAHDIYRQFES